MSERPDRIVFCADLKQLVGFSPQQIGTRLSYVEIARCFGDALELPSVAVEKPLEACEPTDFVFYDGDWDNFVGTTPSWSVDQHLLRARRAAHLVTSRGREYAAFLEATGFALAIPSIDSAPRPNACAEIYARRDVAKTVPGFDIFEVFHSESYASILSPKGMRQAEMVARYLSAYWDMFGF